MPGAGSVHLAAAPRLQPLRLRATASAHASDEADRADDQERDRDRSESRLRVRLVRAASDSELDPGLDQDGEREEPDEGQQRADAEESIAAVGAPRWMRHAFLNKACTRPVRGRA
jgi:hypothetical protein